MFFSHSVKKWQLSKKKITTCNFRWGYWVAALMNFCVFRLLQPSGYSAGSFSPDDAHRFWYKSCFGPNSALSCWRISVCWPLRCKMIKGKTGRTVDFSYFQRPPLIRFNRTDWRPAYRSSKHNFLAGNVSFHAQSLLVKMACMEKFVAHISGFALILFILVQVVLFLRGGYVEYFQTFGRNHILCCRGFCMLPKKEGFVFLSHQNIFGLYESGFHGKNVMLGWKLNAQITLGCFMIAV